MQDMGAISFIGLCCLTHKYFFAVLEHDIIDDRGTAAQAVSHEA